MYHLYRAVTWWQRGVGCVSFDPKIHTCLPMPEALLALGLAAFVPHTIHGDSMEDCSSKLQLITPPASEPVSVSEAKLFLRIEHTADDAVITRAIGAARQAAEQYLRRALLPQTWEYSVGRRYVSVLRLPFGPASTITSVKAYDEDDEETIVSVEDYRLSLDGRQVLFDAVPEAEKLVVRYSAATAATAEDVPALIRQGMLHHIAAMLDQREGAVPMPIASLSCYQPYREVGL